jgi:CMP-N,N'-diacetyllegionaminic acid synthase
MRVLGIVTARGGSRSIPMKNIVPLAGRPLLAYTADAVRGSRLLSKTVLSTDDPEIARVGTECGLEVPFLRPAMLARDETPTVPVLQFVVLELEKMGEKFDAVMTLQPTSPLRLSSDIDGAIELMERTGADSVVSCTEVGFKHPARMKVVDEDGRMHDSPFSHLFSGTRRQGWDPYYVVEGAVYLTSIDLLMAHNSIRGADCRAWLIPPERACDIDSQSDLIFAEQVLKSRLARAV